MMHDTIQALVDALADAAATEEKMASQLADMSREACELGFHNFEASFLKVARAHRAAAIRHRAQHGAILHHHGLGFMAGEEPAKD